MFSRILVPLDGSPLAGAALPAARILALTTGASVALVRVVDRGDAAEATRALDAVREELQRGGLQTEALVRHGHPADEIIAACREAGAAAIVMTTHGRTGLDRAFRGSVAQRVIAESPVPVLVLRPGGKRISAIKRLLVPVDGTAGGALALGVASALARAADARVDLVEVVPPLPTWMYGGLEAAPSSYVDPDWEQASLASARAYIEDLVQRLKSAGLQAEGRVAQGEVAQTIDQVADELDTDVIVMSTHALTGPKRAVLGSVADEVVRTSARPVLLVRRPEDALESDA